MKGSTLIKKSILLIFVIIIVIFIINLFQTQTKTKFNQVLQVNLNQIYQSINTADSNLNNKNLLLTQTIDTFIDDCYTATKTISIIDIPNYNLDDFFFFLLYLRDFESYNLTDKEKIINAINLMDEAFYKTHWDSTKGLGIPGYYNFISDDVNKIESLIAQLNKISSDVIEKSKASN